LGREQGWSPIQTMGKLNKRGLAAPNDDEFRDQPPERKNVHGRGDDINKGHSRDLEVKKIEATHRAENRRRKAEGPTSRFR